MSFEFASPFSPATRKAVPSRAEMVQATLGKQGRDVLEEFDERDEATVSDTDGPDFAFTEAEVEQMEHVSQLLRRAHENAARISGPQTQVLAYLHIAQSEIAVGADPVQSYRHVLDYLEQEGGGARDFFERYEVLTTLLAYPKAPDTIIDEALETRFVEGVTSSSGRLYLEMLDYARQVRSGENVEEDVLEECVEKAVLITEEDWAEYAFETIVSAVKIQHASGRNPDLLLDRAWTKAWEVASPRSRLMTLVDLFMEIGEHDQLIDRLGLAYVRDPALVRELLVSIIEHKELPIASAKKAYDIQVNTIREQTFANADEPKEEDQAFQELSMRSQLAWGEKRFGDCRFFPEFESWKLGILARVQPDGRPYSRILMTEIYLKRGEDASVAFQEAKDGFASLPEEERRQWLTDILRLEVEHGYPYEGTLKQIEDLTAKIVDEDGVNSSLGAISLARIFCEKDFRKTELYLVRLEKALEPEDRTYLMGYRGQLANAWADLAVNRHRSADVIAT